MSTFSDHPNVLRQGVISLPARVLQAFAPLIFGVVLERYGINIIWLTVALGLLVFAALMTLRASEASHPAHKREQMGK
jgi:hypothetical protein